MVASQFPRPLHTRFQSTFCPFWSYSTSNLQCNQLLSCPTILDKLVVSNTSITDGDSFSYSYTKKNCYLKRISSSLMLGCPQQGHAYEVDHQSGGRRKVLFSSYLNQSTVVHFCRVPWMNHMEIRLSFNKQLLSFYLIPGTTLGSEDTQ